MGPKLAFLATLAVLASVASAAACAACYGQTDSELAEGMNAGILFLLACIGAVLLGFASFFVYLARRSAATARRAAATATTPA